MPVKSEYLKIATHHDDCPGQPESSHTMRHTVAWNNFRDAEEDVEKLIYPLKIGDEVDCGAVNEVLSQLDVFQGTLEHFNESKDKQQSPCCLLLPNPFAM